MRHTPRKLYYVYIMPGRQHGVLYVGMTSTLPNRTWQHREHVREGFTKRYWGDRLVYFEAHTDARMALGASAPSSGGGASGRSRSSRSTIRLGATCSPRC